MQDIKDAVAKITVQARRRKKTPVNNVWNETGSPNSNYKSVDNDIIAAGFPILRIIDAMETVQKTNG